MIPRTFSIRAVLILLVLLLLTPLLAFGALLMARYAETEEAQVKRQALEIAHRAAFALDQDIARMQAALLALGATWRIGEKSLDEFHAEALEVAEATGAEIALRDPRARLVITTRAPLQQPLLARVREAALSPAAKSTSLYVTNLEARPGGSPVVVVALPLWRGADHLGMLTATLSPDRLRRNLVAGASASSWTMSIVDRTGRIVARSVAQERFIGQRATADLRRHAVGSAGAWRGFTVDGTPVMAAYARSDLSGFVVAVGAPERELSQPLWRSAAALVGVGLFAVGLSLGAGIWLSGVIIKALDRITESSKTLAAGAVAPVIWTRVRELRRLSLVLHQSSIDLRYQTEERLRAEQALRASENRLLMAQRAADAVAWEWDVRAGTITWSDREMVRKLTGEDLEAVTPYECWLARVHPEDAAVRRTAGEMAIKTGSADVAYRIVRNGELRWLKGLGQVTARDIFGHPVKVAGITFDITEQKRAEEHQRLLINELNHRVKNSLAIVQGLAQQSFKADVPPQIACRSFEARLAALSAAHNLLTRQNWEAAPLRQIIEGSVAAAAGADAARVTLEGPDVPLAPQTAVAFAMAVHELSTNAIKYGALSSTTGHVGIRWDIVRNAADNRLELVWREAGGPPVVPPTRRGFGTRMIERSLAAERNGAVELNFRAQGLVCTISADLQPAD